jgi:hypothetical protein
MKTRPCYSGSDRHCFLPKCCWPDFLSWEGRELMSPRSDMSALHGALWQVRTMYHTFSPLLLLCHDRYGDTPGAGDSSTSA